MTETQRELKKKELKRHVIRCVISAAVVLLLALTLFACQAHAESSVNITLDAGTDTGTGIGPVELLFLLALLALLPSLLIMMTSFTRIVIVLSFLRNALGIQQTPPNQVLVGIALFLTLFIMAPVLGQINDEAYQPYKTGQITQEEMMDRAQDPIKVFMLKQTGTKELELFLSLSGEDAKFVDNPIDDPTQLTQLSLTTIVPAFMTSELKRAFEMGFLIFIPFLIIDIVVSSTLMSMGMVMLPPTMIALPFKIMVFVVVDGWGLLFQTLVNSFVT
ncbi:MAG: flagellar type III secretion system pore protein FliP [Oscillospiraceae bacterium]|nr:flagellar type III secretion system pore protein FliP [Oscillospiraceae bacterium]